MAALTQNAVDGLLGLLSKAIQDEAKLIGGVPGDMKFIKDEMDSMNGFLLHLNKMEGEHDDQVRAWMKQVHEVACVAEECVERYVRDMDRHGIDRGGCAGYAAMARLFLLKPRTYLEIHKLGKQITELKARVLEVGERRLRYDVKIPDRGVKKVQNKLPAHAQEEERREAFVHKLEEELEKDVKVPVLSDEAATICGIILKKCSPPADQDQPPSSATMDIGGAAAAEAEARAFRCTKKMFLCALYVYPYPTNKELQKLQEGVEAPGVGAQEAMNQVMVFCYSLLSTQQKSCLQYLTAFLQETEISRTSMVRRWVAEGLVGKEPGGRTTPEEAGEQCFHDLLLRGFVRAARRSDTGTVKSCVMDDPVQDFIVGITKSENFLEELPPHLERQLKIRRIVQQPGASKAPPPPPRNVLVRHCNLRCCGGGGTWLDDHDDTTKNHMDKLVDFIKTLPELYRLNVLDLGGCTGLESRHLKSFGEVDCLKYLSLRKTDVSRLHAKHINKLKLLETLDIRATYIPPGDTKKIYLPQLKHFLAGRFATTTATATTTTTGRTLSVEKATLVTVDMPDRIGSMRYMETLSQVQVSIDGAELQGVAKLQQLRKLGVVVHANTATAAVLGRVLYVLAGCLRSLSVWVVDVPRITSGISTEGVLDISSMHEMASSMALENLHIKGKMSLPSWIGRAPKLANVTLRDTEMDGGDALRRLATVPSLCCLKLSRKAFTEQALRFKDVQFQALRVLVIEGDAFTGVAFFAGDAAAPKLEKIAWTIGGGSTIAQTLHNEELIVGIQHLPSLKEIELRASFKVNDLLDWTSRQQTTPANPRYRIRYISSTDRNQQLITELPKAATDTTLTLPAGVIN